MSAVWGGSDAGATARATSEPLSLPLYPDETRLNTPPLCPTPLTRSFAPSHSWGKRILALSGAQDKLVHPSFSQHFLARLLVSEPTGPGGEQQGLRVRFLEGVKHEVNDEMVREAGEWVGVWGMMPST